MSTVISGTPEALAVAVEDRNVALARQAVLAAETMRPAAKVYKALLETLGLMHAGNYVDTLGVDPEVLETFGSSEVAAVRTKILELALNKDAEFDTSKIPGDSKYAAPPPCARLFPQLPPLLLCRFSHSVCRFA